MKNLFLFLFVFYLTGLLFAQQDSVVVLDEVVLTDIKLSQFSDGVKVDVLTDSVIRNNQGTLNDNLRNTTHIYFRENGYGMVSSASFRGTGAQQTAVVWNGININSQLNGQTDLNTILLSPDSEITVRSGGGSTQYGTGAIGGTVHLNDRLYFKDHFQNKLNIGYGSFNTRNVGYSSSLGGAKRTVKIGLGHLASDNDFKYLGIDRRNENGAFSHYNFDVSAGFSLTNKTVLKVFHNTFLGDRNFSGTLTAASDDNYQDHNSRSLIELVSYKGEKVQRFRAAHLYERYRYYPNTEREDFSFGKANTYLLNYDYKLRWKEFVFDGILEGSHVKSEGSSIQPDRRNTLSGIFLFSHRPNEKLGYGINLRKDWVNDFDSPFVFALNGKYEFTDTYSIHINGSKNYRIPTFNDLYWTGSGATGNPELLPETSNQVELGQTFSGESYKIGLTGYYIDSNDLVQWRPDSAGIWSPMNISNALQYGAEVEVELQTTFQNHSLDWILRYAYTKSIDELSENQLLYVPLHKLSSNLAYRYRKWGSFLQLLHNGRVFTTTDNNQELPGYALINFGIAHTFKKVLGTSLVATAKVNNITNKSYQNVAFRPMPNRNFNLQLNFKF